MPLPTPRGAAQRHGLRARRPRGCARGWQRRAGRPSPAPRADRPRASPRSVFPISATCARCPLSARVVTPRAEVMARTSGAPWNSTMTRERPVSCRARRPENAVEFGGRRRAPARAPAQRRRRGWRRGRRVPARAHDVRGSKSMGPPDRNGPAGVRRASAHKAKCCDRAAYGSSIAARVQQRLSAVCRIGTSHNRLSSRNCAARAPCGTEPYQAGVSSRDGLRRPDRAGTRGSCGRGCRG